MLSGFKDSVWILHWMLWREWDWTVKNLHYREKAKMAREVTSTMQARTQEVFSLLSITSRICFNIFSFIFHNPVSFVIFTVKSKPASWEMEFVFLQLQPLFRKNLKLTTIMAPSGCWVKNQICHWGRFATFISVCTYESLATRKFSSSHYFSSSLIISLRTEKSLFSILLFPHYFFHYFSTSCLFLLNY